MTKLQRIRSAIGSRLKLIRKVNGYRTDIGANVFTWRVAPIQFIELPCIIFFEDSNTQESGTISTWRWRLNIKLHILLAEGGVSHDEAVQMIQDVFDAIKIDTTWGELAVETEQPSFSMFPEHDEKIIMKVEMSFDVIYDTNQWEV